jgi:hypothetical protein
MCPELPVEKCKSYAYHGVADSDNLYVIIASINFQLKHALYNGAKNQHNVTLTSGPYHEQGHSDLWGTLASPRLN